MKKTAVFLAALVAGSALRADEAPAAPAAPVVPAEPAAAYSVTADFSYVSSYVFRGYKLADDAIQPSIKLAVGNAYAGVWLSEPVDSEFDNEIDFYGGYTFALSDGWSLDVGATLYYYPEAPASADESTFEGYVGLTGTVGGVTLGGYVYQDFTLEATTVQGNVGYGIPISDKVSCNLSANLGYVTYNEGDDYTYYGVSVQLPWKISDHATLTLGGSYANNDIPDAEDDLFWVNAGFSYTF
jgi:uncharacterized protein (TIGR02001 family)